MCVWLEIALRGTISAVTSSGTHRAPSALPRAPFAGLLGLTLGTPAIVIIVLAAWVLVSVASPLWLLPAAAAGALLGVTALRLPATRRPILHPVAAVAGLILLALSVAVVALEILASMA